MKYHYKIVVEDLTKFNSIIPEDEEHGRFFMESFPIAIKYLFDYMDLGNEYKIDLIRYEFSIDDQFTGEQLIKAAKHGVSFVAFSPKQREIDKLKSRLSDEVAQFIKYGYYEQADKIYDLIKDL